MCVGVFFPFRNLFLNTRMFVLFVFVIELICAHANVFFQARVMKSGCVRNFSLS